jgi:hypothetical protein
MMLAFDKEGRVGGGGEQVDILKSILHTRLDYFIW